MMVKDVWFWLKEAEKQAIKDRLEMTAIMQFIIIISENIAWKIDQYGKFQCPPHKVRHEK